ncbi:MAG: hypothetical protein J6B77_06475, partial [Clostridia bacterium]|nr:hypothetical protein [Clostridia bacterium]
NQNLPFGQADHPKTKKRPPLWTRNQSKQDKILQQVLEEGVRGRNFSKEVSPPLAPPPLLYS